MMWNAQLATLGMTRLHRLVGYRDSQRLFPRPLDWFANRGVDTTVVLLIAIALANVGRLTQPAALLLLVTLPFSPQIGYDSLEISVASVAERWLEFLATFVGVVVVLSVAARTKCSCSSRAQVIALSAFFFVAMLGLWNMNPRGFSGPPLQNELKADNNAVVPGAR